MKPVAAYILLVIVITVVIIVISVRHEITKSSVYVLDDLSTEFIRDAQEKYNARTISWEKALKKTSGKIIFDETKDMGKMDMTNNTLQYAEDVSLKSSEPFPRIVHQVYLGYSGPMPDEWKNYHEIWKEQVEANGWEMMLWDLQMCRNLILESDFPEFIDAFDNYKYGVQKADAIRYFILYKYGGIYSDLDVYPNMDITPMLEMYEQNTSIKAMFCMSPQDRKLSNWFMVARPESRFFLKCISLMSERHNKTMVNKHFTVLWTTGPIMVQSVYNSYPNQDELLIIPREVLSSDTFCPGGCNISNYALLTNDQSGSWNSGPTRILNAITCAAEPVKDLSWMSWLFILVLVVVVGLTSFVVTYKMYATCRQMCMR